MGKEKYISGAVVGGALLFTFLWLRARAAPPSKWSAKIGTPTFSEVE